ncbi:DUF1616 domain-containing protein [Ignisphaera sp. 4213-co]|uniref:DUF1616 domain-containing protein n=1 Tax=Ignisphaera cupida TaxID=3050454 RepID=A0ABD4Z6G5_9CREN|nr:DUF1616 domain-containing protein [Ignisphaera sp. 4213-co]MDK6027925.1 DUF1616 domain-containing protein [Ignisphaera sp. 4213-co]
MRQETKNKDVKTLEEYVEEIAKSSGNRVNAIRKVFQDVASGKAILVDPNTPRDFVEYILRTDYSLWLWTIYTIVILTLVSIATTSLIPITAYIRYVLGSITVLFLPGYVTIEALYPEEKELSNLE